MATELDGFEAMMNEWFDELAPRVDAYRMSFPDGGEGLLKYLFSLHMMISAMSQELNIPTEVFSQFVSRTTVVWYAAGKPEDFNIAVGMKKPSKPN